MSQKAVDALSSAIDTIRARKSRERTEAFGKALFTSGDLSPENVQRLAGQFNLDISDEDDRAIIASGLALGQQAQQYAASKQSMDFAKNTESRAAQTFENQQETFGQQQKEWGLNAPVREAERTVALQKPTADLESTQAATSANNALAKLRNAQASAADTPSASDMKASIEVSQYWDNIDKQNRAVGLAADASAILVDEKGRAAGTLEIVDTGTHVMAGIVPVRKLADFKAMATKYGYRVIQGATQKIDVPGTWNDEKGIQVTLMPLTTATPSGEATGGNGSGGGAAGLLQRGNQKQLQNMDQSEGTGHMVVNRTMPGQNAMAISSQPGTQTLSDDAKKLIENYFKSSIGMMQAH